MKKKNLIVGILEKKLTDSKDWTGNKASVYKTLAASNHSSSEREKNDFYAPFSVKVRSDDEIYF